MEATPPRPRLLSLDAMRGLVVLLMLLVNMTWNRDVFPRQFFHVEWNDPAQGVTLADLVFPWFVFIAGAAVPLSLRGGRGSGRSAAAILAGALRRGAVLYLLGVLLTVASFAHERPLQWSMLLSWNILQLLGASYVVVVAVWLATERVPERWRAAWRVALVAAAWLGRWALLALAPYEWVTGFVKPRPIDGAPVGPGTWAHHDAVNQWLNREFVAVPTTFDLLAGWLGMLQQVLPLAAIGVVGGLATTALEAGRLRRVAVVGVGLVLVAFALRWGYRAEGGGLWGTATVPFSKWLISPAYCALAAGTGSILLAAIASVVDRKRWTTLWPLRVVGMNPLAVYVGAELSFNTIFTKWLLPLPDGGSDTIAAATQAWLAHATSSPLGAGLGWAAIWIVLWWCVAWRMDRAGVYVRA
ncbi:MAG: heparan-alpha-glucosaminide N-acetyltransferase domain-containing protein [Lacipirellulaceae bacterium]